MNFQPGAGYGFTSSGYGISLDASNPFPDDGPVEVCPFTIRDQSSGTTYKFGCTAGMINSIIPQIGITADPAKRLDQTPPPTTTYNFDPTTGYSYIYLKVSADYSSPPTQYPVSLDTDILYPRIISTSTQQEATDDSAFFLLAVAYQDQTNPGGVATPIIITQLTCGSQWTDRIKVGTSTAKYFFARV